MHGETNAREPQMRTHPQAMEARPRIRRFRTRSTNPPQRAECCLCTLPFRAALWSPVRRHCLRDLNGNQDKRMTGRRTGVVHLVGSRVRNSYFARRKPRTRRCPATLRNVRVLCRRRSRYVTRVCLSVDDCLSSLTPWYVQPHLGLQAFC